MGYSVIESIIRVIEYFMVAVLGPSGNHLLTLRGAEDEQRFFALPARGNEFFTCAAHTCVRLLG